MRANLDIDISKSGEEKSISSVDEDDERIVLAEDEKYARGEVDPRVAKFSVMLGTQNVFDKRLLSKPKVANLLQQFSFLPIFGCSLLPLLVALFCDHGESQVEPEEKRNLLPLPPSGR
ncbi:hypothetical protein U1Q18_032752 [Sarracenia purpurea var. burkii]